MMPDYSYLKKKVEDEQKSKDEAFKEEIRKYYDDDEERMIDFCIEEIKKNIENAVYHFYKNGLDTRIEKKGFLLKQHYYSESLSFHVWVIGGSGISIPEDLSPSLNFPDKICFDSFIKKINTELNKDGISVKAEASKSSKGRYTLYVWAELGEL